MKGFETRIYRYLHLTISSKKECPAMKGFETPSSYKLEGWQGPGKKECPAMKGFETKTFAIQQLLRRRKKECPAMKGFETYL